MRFLSYIRMSILFGIAVCAICAADPQQETQNGGGMTPGTFSSHFPSPVPGLPVPMDLKAAEEVTLSEIHVTAAIRQHEAMILYTCIIDLPEDARKTTVPVAIPFLYNIGSDTPLSYAPIHRLPFSKAVTDIQVGANSIRMDYKIREGQHPQHDAPSLESVNNANYWLTSNIKLNPGRNTVTFNFTIPYIQTISGRSGRQAQTTVSSSRLDIILATAGAWGNLPTKAEMEIYGEEVLPDSLKIINADHPEQAIVTQKSEKGVITVDLLKPFETDGTLRQISIQSGSNYQFTVNAEDLPDNIDRLTSILVNGKRMAMNNNYTVTASSTMPVGLDGEPGSPENLKTGRRFWAENASGDGEGESITITLNNPQRLAGFVIQPGASPMILGRNDTEALRYPDVAFSLHSRPRSFDISLNEGEYNFKATLRDDWNPQLIEVPYFKKSVKTIKITFTGVYQGTASDNTYITTILPVTQ